MTERHHETQESTEQVSTWEPVVDAGTPTLQGSSTAYPTGSPTSHTPDRTTEYPASGNASPETPGGTGAVMKDEAASVAHDAKAGTARVADTAKSEVKDVAAETTAQVKQLLTQLRTELNDQASTQSGRAVGGLRSLADELSQMVSGSGVQQRGLATDLAQQASDKARDLAGWLENREPGELLDDVRSFARRRPGTFLVAAAAVGVIGGRLTRGLSAAGDEATTGTPGAGATGGYPAAGSYPATGTNGVTDPYASTAPYAATGTPTPSTYTAEDAYPASSTYTAENAYPATATYPAAGEDNGLGIFDEERR